MTMSSSAAGNLCQAKMGPNSNTKTPETHNIDAQMSNCFEKKRRCNTMVNMQVGLGDMAQKIITIIIFISVDIDNYHDKCQIFISFKFKAIFLLQSESFRNQTINFP